MEKTYKYKITTTDNSELFDKTIEDYTGLFFKLYNNLELSEDKGFIKECMQKFGLDKTIYDYCLVDARMSYSSLEEIKADKKHELDDIKKQLDGLYKIKKPTKKQLLFKKSLIDKRQEIKRSFDKNICFGTKCLLRKITKIQQKETKTKKDIIRLKKYKKEFKEKRKRTIFLWGKAIEGGNRKIDFFLKENYIILKMDKKRRVKISVVPFKGKNRKSVLDSVEKLLKSNSIALTVRVSRTHVCITFDNLDTSGFGFDKVGFNLAIKDNRNIYRTRKDILKEFYAKQLETKLKDKIKTRAVGIDPNPGKIGFSVVDVDPNTDEIKKVVFQKTFCFDKYMNITGISIEEKKKLNRKFKYELYKTINYIADKCTHYKVGYFGLENLKKITKEISDKGKTFNRLTKNLWNKELIFDAIMMKCDELGMVCNDIPPEYTSFIGNIKNEFYDPAASSTEIARRSQIKYKINAKLFPFITEKDHEKLTYLIGEDSTKYKNWVSLYKKFKNNKEKFSGDKWRNKNFSIDGYLYTVKSNVTICS